MKKYLLYFIVFVALSSCIEPYEVTVEEGDQLLTIDGMITSGPGPHTIKLTRSATYGSVFEGLIRPVAGATVIVRDDLGNVAFLAEDIENRGEYLTSSEFSATEGRAYTLQIQLADGKVYTSFPETAPSVPAIQEITYQVQKFPVEGEINEESGIQFIASVLDPIEEDNFYYWKQGPAVYVLETSPELYVEPAPSREPAPKDCCDTCYRFEQNDNTSVFIAQDENFNGLATRIPAAFVLDDGMRFVNKFRVDIEQYGISADAYRFLKLVQQQVGLSGSVFDPPPANIRGNMISLDDPEEVVLGYFMAAGETSKRVYISTSDLDFKQPVDIIPDDCREVEGAQLAPPADWEF